MSYSDDGWGDDEVQVAAPLKIETPVLTQSEPMVLPPKRVEPAVENVQRGFAALSTAPVAPVNNEWAKKSESRVADMSATLASISESESEFETTVAKSDFDTTIPNSTAENTFSGKAPWQAADPVKKSFGEFGGNKSEVTQGQRPLLARNPSSEAPKPSFGRPESGFGSAVASSFGSQQNVPKAEPPTPSFGGTAPSSGFGDNQKTSFATNPIGPGFGGQQVKPASKSSAFGNPDSGFGSAMCTGFGGGSNAAKPPKSEFGQAEPAPIASVGKPVGFGNPKPQPSSEGGLGFGSTTVQSKSSFGPSSGAGFGSADNGFGTSRAPVKSEFGGSSQPSSGFGRNATGFGAQQNTGFGAQQNSGFGGPQKSGFGGQQDSGFGEPQKSGFGAQQDSGFGGPQKSGFGTSQNAGFGAQQNSGFGGQKNTGFGAQSSSGFGQNDNGFGGGMNRGEQNRGRGCHNCGEEGHISRECPNPKVGGNGCRNCGEEGHFSRECTNPKVVNGGCRNCGQEGHFSRDCDQPRRPTGPCHNCGEEGHFSKDCQNERVRREPTEPCRRCAEEGHWASECPMRPRDLQGNLLVPYDVVFTPEEEMFAEAVDNDSRIDFDQKVSAYMGTNQMPDAATFEAFKSLPPELHKNLRHMKLNRPTPIQRATFYQILNGSDVVACAHTGCGKTLAFLMPLVIKLYEERRSDERDEKPSPDVLIIAPTRELASQTFNTARQLIYQTGLTCGLAYGGYSRSSNLQHLNSFARLNILVATMGRLQDYLESNEVSFERLKHVVLDEADRMVDSNDFGAEVSKILGAPEERSVQTLLFSASFSENLQRDDLPNFVKKGYIMLQVNKFGTANEKIDQKIINVPRAEKRETLCKLLGIDENTYTLLPNACIEKEKTLIFVNSVKFSDSLAAFMASCGVTSIAMHSHQNQESRDNILADFRRGRWQCLVASNVAARGLNIAALDHVVNYDMPDKKGFDEYVNRIGRTGRAGYSGRSTAFFDEEADREIVPDLVAILTDANKEVPDWLQTLYEQADTEAVEQDDEEW